MLEQSQSSESAPTSSPGLPTGKRCTKCGEFKGLSEFFRRAASPDGLQHKCKPCDNADRREHEKRRPDLAGARYARYRAGSRVATRAAWYARNKTSVVLRAALHKLANRERHRELARAYYRRNREDFPARVALRRAKKKQAMPLWADQSAIKAIYAEAIRLTKETGVKHHVDHIVPLQHALVCGLHCEANLRVITARENHAKNNRYWPGMP